MPSTDVAIVGAGVIGAAIAYELARSTKLRISVIERGTPGCEASNAAAGVLAVASSHARHGALLELRRLSAGLFPELVASLQDETGMALGYQRAGLIAVAFSDAEAAELEDLVTYRNGQGLRCEALDRAGVLALEPAVNSQVRAGAFFRDECSIDSERLVGALVSAARSRGVTFRLRTAVRSVSAAAGVVALQLDREAVEAAVAVVATGAWSAVLLASCGVKVPVRPARGEMAAVHPLTWRLGHTVTAGDGYLVPRRGGEVLIGSTTAFVGFDKTVSPDGLATLLTRAQDLVPQVRETPLRRTWAGLRPCPTIRRPIIARVPGLENVLLATGHHRNGILLAPITAKLVAELITGTEPSVALQPFGYRRR